MSRKLLFAAGLVSICAALPLLTPPGSGLVNAEPVGQFLNGVFPSSAPFGSISLEVAYPNLSFSNGLTYTMHPHDDTVFVGQRDGLVHWFIEDDNATVKNTFIDLRSEVGYVWDGGFLGLALHPDFGVPGQPERNSFFVYFCTKDGNGGNDPQCCLPQPCISGANWNGGYNILRKYEVLDGTLTVDPSSQVDMFKVRHYNSTHYGGGLFFGDDGFLYLSTGDQAQHNVAQDITTNIDGAVLRFDVDMDPTKSHAPVHMHPKDPRASDEFSGQGYWIPNDNPWSGQANVFEEYWSMGHRNPHRMTKDMLTGDIWNGEIGAGTHEEVNRIIKGRNYGWPKYEGYALKNTCVSTLLGNMPHEGPVLAFPRSNANALIGGYVYRGSAVPQLYGKFICADYGSGNEVWSVDRNTGQFQQITNHSTSGSPITFGQDAQGELYIMASGNNRKIYRLVSQNANSSVPQTLSQTGIFSDLATLTPAQGVLPYELIESFWSDGAIKKRWLSVPNDGTHDTPSEQVKYDENGVWEFPQGSVLIKHFELPLDASNPGLVRRLETRVIVINQPGQAYGVTYKWRADGSDADLLSDGLEESVTADFGNGPEQFTWQYPSRGECLACHNLASKGTLGLRSRNLNSDFAYPSSGITANQIVSLSAIGVLDETVTDADVESIITHAVGDDLDRSLADRARSYLDVNCAYCHQPATDNRAEFDARLKTPFAAQNLLTSNLNASLGIPGEAVIVPYDTARSVLYQRLNTLAPHKMPLIGKNRIDAEGSALIAEWIMNMDTTSLECSPLYIEPTVVLPYGGGQDNGTFEVLDNGVTIRVADNGWKAIPLEYTVTPNTMLAFNFKSSQLGEEHSIGLHSSLSLTNTRFQVYGTQQAVAQTFNTYSGSAQYEAFVIPIGQFLSGLQRYLFFACDKDAAPVQSESIFNNVRLYEDPNAAGPCTAPSFVSISPKVYLEGPYDMGNFNDAMRAAGILPFQEPYSMQFNLVNAGGEKTTNAMLEDLGNNVVDWILMELRDSSDPTIIVASKPALLFQDGSVRGHLGGPVKFEAPQGQYHVAVRHRNHLGVMTANTVALGIEAIPLDFTDVSLPLYGTNAASVATGVRMLWAGDANSDGVLKYTGVDNDRDQVLLEIGGSVPTNVVPGYVRSDVNLDGVTKYQGVGNDRDRILLSVGGSVITNTRSEQLP